MGQQALQGPPAGVLLCYSAYQALKWPSSLGPFSVLRGGEGCSAGFTDSAVSPGLHGRWPFVHRDLPRVSSGHLPAVRSRQLPATVYSRGLASLSRVRRAAARIVRVVLTPFRRSQISCGTPQQPQMLALCPKQLPRCGDLTPASVPPPCGYRSSPAHSRLFSFPSFCEDLYIPCWWSGTPAYLRPPASEGVTLMHP